MTDVAHHAGEKRHLSWLRHYLVAVTRGGQPSTAAGSAGAALHLYDLRNKLVAASLPLPEVRQFWRSSRSVTWL